MSLPGWKTLLERLENIKINAQSVNLNTDDLEELILETNSELQDIINQLQSIFLELISSNTFGQIITNNTIIASNISQLIISSNNDRKEVIIRNASSKIMYITFSNPATNQTAIFLNKDEIWIEDRYRGNIYAIFEPDVSGNAFIIEISE